MGNSIESVSDFWLRQPTKNGKAHKDARDIQRVSVIVRYFGNKKDINSISKIDILKFKDFLELEKGYSAGTVQRFYSTFNAIMNFAFDNEFSEKKIHIKTRKVKGKEVYLTPDEVRKFIGQLDPLRAAIVEFGVFTGQRKSNLINLRWDSLSDDLQEWTQEASEMKNAEPNVLAIGSKARAVLRRMKVRCEKIEEQRPYLRGRVDHVFAQEKSGKPFNIYTLGNKTWKRALKKSGIDKDVTPHTLRHTFASLLVKNGVDLYQIKEAGGWSDLKSVIRYAHVGTGTKRKTVNQLDKLF